jgi:CheY-like chemotaxis protein
MGDETQGKTRHLNPENLPPITPRGTGPLDYMIPWVIEFRVVGTPHVVHAEVSERLVIGRSDKKQASRPDIDLEPFNAYNLGVSRQHAVIAARNSRITIRDNDSANGTFLNGGKLDSGQEFHLRHGDALTLGKLQLQVAFVVTPSSHEKHGNPFADVAIPTIGSGQRVLLVDDDSVVTQAISSVLRQAGFQVETAGNVGEALTYVDRRLPDIVVTELMLADMSGLELVRYVRERPGGNRVPLVIISGVTGGYQMGQAIDAGVDIFLTKPVGVDELLRSFTKVIGGTAY